MRQPRAITEGPRALERISEKNACPPNEAYKTIKKYTRTYICMCICVCICIYITEKALRIVETKLRGLSGDESFFFILLSRHVSRIIITPKFIAYVNSRIISVFLSNCCKIEIAIKNF